MATNGDAGGGGDAGMAPKKKAGQQSIEETYQKKSQLEHILLRPDTYIGSVEKTPEKMWIYDSETDSIILKEIQFVPGLYKIFDEILVNAADNKQRDPTMNMIKINIDPEANTISVWNNGQGIPVVHHKDEKMYVPTMIFGHLLTSSNYNDEELKVTGGRNGYGAKLCNIFSTKFVVETAAREYKRQFKQTWADNMSKVSEPKVKDFSGEDYTKVTFTPDLVKFKMDKLDADIVGLMSRRAYDVAASTRGVKVFLNNKKLPVKNFKDYIELYIRNRDGDHNLKVIYESPNSCWEVGLTTSDKGFQQMSFVNSIATTKGGRHVDYVVDMISKQLVEVLKKKNKGGAQVNKQQVKQHMWIFINCLIVNPNFDSQTKENMTLQVKGFGSKCTLSPGFMAQAAKSGIVESALIWAKFKAQTDLTKTSGKKQSKLKGIPKLEDANEAGKMNSLKCTLILTEGDSAKSLAVSGLGVIGRDYYGVFPLKGKLLNVREATHKQILENQEICSLIKIIGLQYKKKYDTVEDMKTLRYGKIMIMTDQDQDGSHIKGLVINFIHFNWPELLQRDFLEEFITPIVKATKRNEKLSFYSLPEFEEWKANTVNHSTFRIKYYKGLGTSTPQEAKEYFQDMDRHRIPFKYGGPQDDEHIVLAFSKKHVEHRKEWLTNFMVESRRRKEIGLPEKYLYTKNTKSITYTDFVNLELVLFSNADNVRSIPCVIDGFKPGQRKVMYTCMKRNDKREVKVAQLAGSIAELSAYHHGEVSLCATIINLAQNFVGSNNINLLRPIGSFGTRLAGGKDAASPRYINTKMSPLTRLIFHPDDDSLLNYQYDDNLRIEPNWYIPILPMVLVNGADGIGTGWMTRIPNYNPREIVANLRAMLNREEPTPMMPWYKNFLGEIVDAAEQRYVIYGEIAVTGANQLEITELPVCTWTQTYKENVLEPLLHGSDKTKALIANYKEYNTDTTVKFVITCLPGQLADMEKEGLHKIFKLQSTISTGSMCAFDDLGCLKRFDSVLDILREFYAIRLDMYDKRKKYIEGMLNAEAERLSDQARFIMEKCNGRITVENKKRKIIIEDLIDKGYSPDPVMIWKEKVKSGDVEDEADANAGDEDDENDEEEEGEGAAKKKTPADSVEDFKEQQEVKKFDYLLGMSMWMLTDEKKQALLAQRDQKLTELSIMKGKTRESLWREDLDAFMTKLNDVEEKERKEAAEIPTNKKQKKAPGKKKALLKETLPSPAAKRIAPAITEEMKKKIQTAIKSKESRNKKAKKENNSVPDEEEDEVDIMLKNNSLTLRQKLGLPEAGEKKGKKKKATDGMKQTKLNFPKQIPETNGTKAKKTKKPAKSTDDSSDDDEFSDDGDEFIAVSSQSDVSPTREKTSRRAAAKRVQYKLSDDDDEEKFTDDEQELKDNDAVKNDSVRQEVMDLSSGSDNDDPPPRLEKSSEDMFDSLVGRAPATSKVTAASKRKLYSPQFSYDSNEEKSKKKKSDDGSGNKKAKPAKKQTSKDVSDDEASGSKSKSATNKKNKKGEDDDDFELPVKQPAKGKAKKMAAVDLDSESDSDFVPKVTAGRTARNVKKNKYVFDDDSDMSD